eukprot:Nk52_evm34s239 gene=Nk52_evmTU34s239
MKQAGVWCKRLAYAIALFFALVYISLSVLNLFITPQHVLEFTQKMLPKDDAMMEHKTLHRERRADSSGGATGFSLDEFETKRSSAQIVAADLSSIFINIVEKDSKLSDVYEYETLCLISGKICDVLDTVKSFVDKYHYLKGLVTDAIESAVDKVQRFVEPTPRTDAEWYTRVPCDPQKENADLNLDADGYESLEELKNSQCGMGVCAPTAVRKISNKKQLNFLLRIVYCLNEKASAEAMESSKSSRKIAFNILASIFSCLWRGLIDTVKYSRMNIFLSGDDMTSNDQVVFNDLVYYCKCLPRFGGSSCNLCQNGYYDEHYKHFNISSLSHDASFDYKTFRRDRCTKKVDACYNHAGSRSTCSGKGLCVYASDPKYKKSAKEDFNEFEAALSHQYEKYYEQVSKEQKGLTIAPNKGPSPLFSFLSSLVKPLPKILDNIGNLISNVKDKIDEYEHKIKEFFENLYIFFIEMLISPCDCEPGRYGHLCQFDRYSLCRTKDSLICSNNGRPVQIGSVLNTKSRSDYPIVVELLSRDTYVCNCNRGWGGLLCDEWIGDCKYFNGRLCNGPQNGRCEPYQGWKFWITRECKCSEKYTGERCSLCANGYRMESKSSTRRADLLLEMHQSESIGIAEQGHMNEIKSKMQVMNSSIPPHAIQGIKGEFRTFNLSSLEDHRMQRVQRGSFTPSGLLGSTNNAKMKHLSKKVYFEQLSQSLLREWVYSMQCLQSEEFYKQQVDFTSQHSKFIAKLAKSTNHIHGDSDLFKAFDGFLGEEDVAVKATTSILDQRFVRLTKEVLDCKRIKNINADPCEQFEQLSKDTSMDVIKSKLHTCISFASCTRLNSNKALTVKQVYQTFFSAFAAFENMDEATPLAQLKSFRLSDDNSGYDLAYDDKTQSDVVEVLGMFFFNELLDYIDSCHSTNACNINHNAEVDVHVCGVESVDQEITSVTSTLCKLIGTSTTAAIDKDEIQKYVADTFEFPTFHFSFEELSQYCYMKVQSTGSKKLDCITKGDYFYKQGPVSSGRKRRDENTNVISDVNPQMIKIVKRFSKTGSIPVVILKRRKTQVDLSTVFERLASSSEAAIVEDIDLQQLANMAICDFDRFSGFMQVSYRTVKIMTLWKLSDIKRMKSSEYSIPEIERDGEKYAGPQNVLDHLHAMVKETKKALESFYQMAGQVIAKFRDFFTSLFRSEQKDDDEAPITSQIAQEVYENFESQISSALDTGELKRELQERITKYINVCVLGDKCKSQEEENQEDKENTSDVAKKVEEIWSNLNLPLWIHLFYYKSILEQEQAALSEKVAYVQDANMAVKSYRTNAYTEENQSGGIKDYLTKGWEGCGGENDSWFSSFSDWVETKSIEFVDKINEAISSAKSALAYLGGKISDIGNAIKRWWYNLTGDTKELERLKREEAAEKEALRQAQADRDFNPSFCVNGKKCPCLEHIITRLGCFVSGIDAWSTEKDVHEVVDLFIGEETEEQAKDWEKKLSKTCAKWEKGSTLTSDAYNQNLGYGLMALAYESKEKNRAQCFTVAAFVRLFKDLGIDFSFYKQEEEVKLNIAYECSTFEAFQGHGQKKKVKVDRVFEISFLNSIANVIMDKEKWAAQQVAESVTKENERTKKELLTIKTALANSQGKVEVDYVQAALNLAKVANHLKLDNYKFATTTEASIGLYSHRVKEIEKHQLIVRESIKYEKEIIDVFNGKVIQIGGQCVAIDECKSHLIDEVSEKDLDARMSSQSSLKFPGSLRQMSKQKQLNSLVCSGRGQCLQMDNKGVSQCSCDYPYGGDKCEKVIWSCAPSESGKPCGENGECVERSAFDVFINGGPLKACQCKDGWRGQACNECLNGIRPVTIEGKRVCPTLRELEKYTLSNALIKDHSNLRYESFFIQDCFTPRSRFNPEAGDLTPYVCSQHGLCNMRIIGGSYKCTCFEGWQGKKCDIPDDGCPVDSTGESKCGGGECVTQTSDHILAIFGFAKEKVCVCEAGKGGPACEQSSCVSDRNTGELCSNRGTCDRSVLSKILVPFLRYFGVLKIVTRFVDEEKCICDPKFSGAICQYATDISAEEKHFRGTENALGDQSTNVIKQTALLAHADFSKFRDDFKTAWEFFF